MSPVTDAVAPRDCVAIDFETAGYEAHSACAVGLARIKGGRITDRFYSLLRPPSRNVMFTWIHGLTWSVLKDAPTFAELWPETAAFLRGADFLLAHNAPFDRRILEGCCRAAGIPASGLPFNCTLKGTGKPARALGTVFSSRKLSVVCGHFGIELRHHHAGSDAEACAALYLCLRDLGVTDGQMRI
ncbi:MAG: 3'-5' exonuclease [Desulfovibrio sp.]|jgi:DNA polymerase-3 subunit epsilon|nr:3'-5' exonuclease [Desulfovibrio sp.]